MTPVDIDKLKGLVGGNDLRAGIVSEVMAYAECNTRDAGELADQILARVLAQVPAALIAKAERVDAMERALTEAAASFDQLVAALREHDAIGLAQEIAVADLSAIDARHAISTEPSETTP